MNTLRLAASVLITAASFLASSTYAFNLTVTPVSPCGGYVCSGQTATATVIFSDPGSQVRFDVVSGAFGIESDDPANPSVATLTVLSGSLSGEAQVTLQANAGAPSQLASLRATHVVTGEQQTVQFFILQNNASTGFQIVPPNATITGPTSVTCSTGVTVTYYILGGFPPYGVTATFPPNAVSLSNVSSGNLGPFFTATTNGTCVDPWTFTVEDGSPINNQVSATLENLVGSAQPGPPGAVLPPELMPQVGLWWNPNESGSGYALDYNNGVLVVTIYSYQADGSPQWYLASGPLSGYTFTSTLDKYTGGQCISCAYSGRPTLIGNDGVVTIIFTSPTSATMYLPGGRVTQIQPEL